MRVFVLTTGRTGSLTFARACAHATNFTAAHESQDAQLYGRLKFPDQHIEVDRLLAWFTGTLGRHYPDAFYVYLTRDEEEAVQSFKRRMPDAWTRRGRTYASVRKALRDDRRMNIEDAFAHAHLYRHQPWQGKEIEDVVRLYIHTVGDNVREFLKNREHMEIDISDAANQYRAFWERIGAKGDLAAATAEFSTKHNRSGAR